MISHTSDTVFLHPSGLGQALTISALIETMIELALRALPVPATGLSPLFEPAQTPTTIAAVLLSSITGTANEKEGATVRAPAKALTDKRVVLQKHGTSGGESAYYKTTNPADKTACGDDEVSRQLFKFLHFLVSADTHMRAAGIDDCSHGDFK